MYKSRRMSLNINWKTKIWTDIQKHIVIQSVLQSHTLPQRGDWGVILQSGRDLKGTASHFKTRSTCEHELWKLKTKRSNKQSCSFNIDGCGRQRVFFCVQFTKMTRKNRTTSDWRHGRVTGGEMTKCSLHKTDSTAVSHYAWNECFHLRTKVQ